MKRQKPSLRITTAQLDFCVGDITGNTAKIISAIKEAREKLKSDVVVFPELALSDYPPGDLLLRADFHQQIKMALQEIKKQTKNIYVIVGYPHKINKKIYNAACVFHNQKLIKHYYKQCLPNSGVFNEKRYFTSGNKPCVFKAGKTKIGLIICEDIWHPDPSRQSAQAGAELIICINASPFDMQKYSRRKRMIRARVFKNKIPIIYAHRVGGQDDLIYDGGSMAMNIDCEICANANFFKEQLWSVDIDTHKPVKIIPQKLSKIPTLEEAVYQALVLGVRDYVNKNNFPGVLIGLSGGIDSSLTAAIAVDALGTDRVEVIAIPSRYTSDLSMRLLKDQIKKLKIKSTIISLEPAFKAFTKSLAKTKAFVDKTPEKTEENIQARCRGIILMAFSNKTGKMVLTTGNKSEMATGYATLYGDMAGGYAPLKDVYKTLVFKLARYRNSISPVIPEEIITRPPTAELAANQTDQDSLPPYDVLDKILEMYVEKDMSVSDIIATGFDKKTVQRVIKLVNCNEYKRRQSAPGPRVTPRAFARERMYPITSKFISS